MKRRFVWLALVAVALGVAVVLYRGPGRSIVRGHVGDVAATMLVYAFISLLSNARLAYRALGTFALAAVIEVGQSWWPSVTEIVLGATLDVWDFVAYAIGVVVAVGWELVAIRRLEGRA